MTTQLEQLKEMIENGASCIEAYEAVDLHQMCEEGHKHVAMRIDTVLLLVGLINTEAGVE